MYSNIRIRIPNRQAERRVPNARFKTENCLRLFNDLSISRYVNVKMSLIDSTHVVVVVVLTEYVGTAAGLMLVSWYDAVSLPQGCCPTTTVTKQQNCNQLRITLGLTTL